MPAYNAERYIASAVRSALQDAALNPEVIIVDDGSTDATVEEVRALGDPRITIVSVPASGGPSRPRNVGVAHARAPYVSLLDSDDLLKPGKLARSIEALDRHPSAGFAFGDFEKMDSDGNVFEASITYAYPVFRQLATSDAGAGWRLIPQPELARGLLYENFIGTSGVVARKDLIVRLGGFDESLPNGDDLDLWFRFGHHCDALYSPEISHSYRVHATSVIHGPPIRNATSRIKVLKRELERWRDPGVRRHLNRCIAENLGHIGYQQRLLGRRWRAVQTYLSAYSMSPDTRWVRDIFKTLLFEPARREAARD
jgi:glycosyltransferase involved in cell wall biosynthesis